MAGTPSRTATAYDSGNTRYSAMAKVIEPRGYVGRKLQAKLRSEEHEVHMRHPTGGRGRVGVQSPIVIRTRGCICDGYVERRSHALPREVCLFVSETESKRDYGAVVKEGPAGRGRMHSTTEQTTYAAGLGEQTREAERSTKSRQKSAESISRRRTAAKEEQMESNRNGAFDE